MERVDVVGEFWKADTPENQVAGRFTFDPIEGGSLNLFGSLIKLPTSGKIDLDDLFPHGETRILGHAGGKRFTLENSYCTQSSRRIIGVVPDASEKYIVPVAFAGAHFDDGTPLDFKSISINIRHLEYWTEKSGLVITAEQSTEPEGTERVIVTRNPIKKLSTNVGQDTLGLSFNYAESYQYQKVSIEQTCCFTYDFGESRSLTDALRICAALQNLVTICLDTLSHVTEVILYREDNTPINFYMSFPGDDLQEKENQLYIGNVLFRFSDIDGINGVGKWLAIADSFTLAIGTLMSRWYMPNLYVENRFFNAVASAETLERIRQGRQSVNLKRGLLNLAAIAGNAFAFLVDDVDRWAAEVVKTRTEHVVHRGLHGHIDVLRMGLLSESLYFLVVLCLLKESGISDDVLANVRDNPRLRKLKDGLDRTR